MKVFTERCAESVCRYLKEHCLGGKGSRITDRFLVGEVRDAVYSSSQPDEFTHEPEMLLFRRIKTRGNEVRTYPLPAFYVDGTENLTTDKKRSSYYCAAIVKELNDILPQVDAEAQALVSVPRYKFVVKKKPRVRGTRVAS